MTKSLKALKQSVSQCEYCQKHETRNTEFTGSHQWQNDTDCMTRHWLSPLIVYHPNYHLHVHTNSFKF